MPRNIEIKTRLESIERIETKVAMLADQGPLEIPQDDTFFHCAAGRLKLREFSATHGELIFYRRSDEAGPKESFYIRSETSEPLALREALSLAYGQSGRVRKNRTLYLIGRTRVHLDRVEGLGSFLELEVVLEEGETSESGVEIAIDLMAQLGVDASQLIKSAYVDLLEASAPPRQTEPYVIREATSEDAQAITNLYQELVSDARIQVLSEQISALAASQGSILLVAESSGTVCGAALLTLCPDVMYRAQPFGVIENFIVTESMRGRGIGRALMKHLDQLAITHDCTKLMLMSGAARHGAHAFFQRCGFRCDTKNAFVKYRREFE